MPKSAIIWIVFALVIAAIVSAGVGWALFSDKIFEEFFGNADLARVGQWGDSFGPFNALISTFGFSAVLATLILQSRSVRDQARDLHRQRFESSFFELLKLMRELRNEVEFRFSKEYSDSRNAIRSTSVSFLSKTVGIKKTGHGGIVAAVQEIRHWLGKEISRPDLKEFLTEVYLKRVHRRSESSLGPYFRIIYTILMRLRENDILSAREKIQYGNLIRSQLTSHEITLLAINGLAPISKDLSSLLIEFRMLKYMPEGTMRRALENTYPQEAFMAR